MSHFPKRINVAINAETAEILERTIARDRVTLTEAVRRLIGVGDIFTTAQKVDHAEIVLRRAGYPDREVGIL